MAYEFVHGTPVFRRPDGQSQEAPVTEALGVIVDLDQGVVLKHGSDSSVQDYWEQMGQLRQFGNYSYIAIPTANMTQGVLDEINRCIATTGAAKGLDQRLSDLMAEADVSPLPK